MRVGKKGRGPPLITESNAIASAVRRIDALFDRPGVVAPVVVEMSNAALVGARVGNMHVRSSASKRWLNKASYRIKCLTNADKLSDEALALQINQAEREHPGTAVFALNLTTADKIKATEVKNVKCAMIAAAARHFGADKSGGKIVVCGSPNAGKSSLILPLTKNRTIQTRKKGAYHLPSISAKAGETLGVKRHTLQVSRLVHCYQQPSHKTRHSTQGGI